MASTRRVQAWHVETGEAAELEWPLSADALRWSIVLAPDGTRIDPQGPAPSGPVFVYSRRTLEAEAGEPAPVALEVEEAAEPSLPVRAEPHTNPMLAAYQAFEYQFTLHAAKAKALRDAIERRRELAGRLFNEADAQVKGMRAAQGNVEATHRELLTEYSTFRDTFVSRHTAHAALLSSFEDDMRRLLNARLHPTLATAQRQTLLDCIPEARFRSWADTCRQEHDQLQARVVELDALMRDLREAVESDPHRNVVDMEPLRRMHTRSGETVRTAAAQSEVLERDLEAIRTTLRTSLAALQAARAFNWASCDGFSTMQKAHETQLLELSDANRLSKDTVAFFGQTKNRLKREVWQRLRNVASLQNRVRDAHNRLAVFRQALQRQTSACDQLLTLHEMPAAYFASLEEVHRRQRFGRQLTHALERVSSRLDAMREAEIGRREAFLERHGRFILKDLVPGLDEPLPSFQLAAPRFDAALPNLGAAPAHLEGAHDDPVLMEPPSLRAVETENGALRQRVRELEERARSLAATAAGALGGAGSQGGMRTGTGEEALAKAEKQRDEYVARIGALENKLSRMYELNNQLQTRLTDTETMASVSEPDPDIKRRLVDAETQAAQVRARLQQTEEQLKKALNSQAQAQGAEVQAADAKERLAALELQAASLRDELRDKSVRLSKAEQECAILQHGVARSEAAVQQTAGDLSRCLAESETLRVKVTAMEAELRDVKQKDAAIAAKLRDSEALLAAVQTQAKEREATLQSQVREREAASGSVAEQVAQKERAMKTLQEQVAQAQVSIASLQARDEEAAAKGANMEQALRESEERRNKLQAETQALEKRMKSLDGDVEAKARQASEQVNVVKSETETVRKQLSEAMQRLGGTEEECSRLRKEKAEAHAAVEQAERQVGEWRNLQQAVNATVASCRVSMQRAPSPASDVQLSTWAVTQLASEYAERIKAEEQARKREQMLKSSLEAMEQRATELSKKVEELSSQVLVRTLELQDLKAQPVGKPPASPAAAANNKAQREAIALRDFEVGDIVMFWSNAQHVYEAYTYMRGGQRSAKYFLSEDSFPSFEKERAASLVIMGTVVSREQLKATGGDYTRLTAGETYYELIVQRLDS